MTDKEDDVKLHAAPSLKLNVLEQLSSLIDDNSASQASQPVNSHSFYVKCEATNVKSLSYSKSGLVKDKHKPKDKSQTEKELGDTNGHRTYADTCVSEKDLPIETVLNSSQFTYVKTRENTATMGNQHSGKKDSDNDTPDEQKQTCCKPPRRKSKDKSNKRTSSRSDENDFDTNEVYPFDSKLKEENEKVEPVDLEPFEIVETDDLSFIAGAGTSGVILSGSDGKFRISREIILEEQNEDQMVENETSDKGKGTATPCKADAESERDKTIIAPNISGNMRSITKSIPESNLAKNLSSPISQVSKASDNHTEESISNENEKQCAPLSPSTDKSANRNTQMIVLSQDMFTKTEIPEPVLNPKSSRGLKSEQIESKGISMQATPKIPEKQNETEQDKSLNANIHEKTKPNDPSDDAVVYENINTKGVETILAKQAPIQAKVPVKYILTQEMFTKESQTENQISNSDSHYEVLQDDNNLYTSTNTNTRESQPKSASSRTASNSNDSAEEKLPLQIKDTVPTSINISNPTYGYEEEDSIISGSHEENIYETVDANDLANIENHIQFCGNELVSKSMKGELKEPAKLFESCKKDHESYIVPNIIHADCDVSKTIEETVAEIPSLLATSESLTALKETEFEKHPLVVVSSDIVLEGISASVGESLNQPIQERTRETEPSLEGSTIKEETSRVLSKSDSLEVPPNDGTLVNSREETVPPPSPASMNILAEENEEDEDENEHTLSNEMIDFGDVVCKRLSQLLEDKSLNDDETATTNVDQDSIIYFSPREFIDTSTGRYEIQDIEKYGDNQEPVIVESKKEPSYKEYLDNGSLKQSDTQEPCSSASKAIVYSQNDKVERLGLKRNESAETLKRTSGDSSKYELNGSSDDGLPDYFDPENLHNNSAKGKSEKGLDSKSNLSLQDFDDTLVQTTPNSSFVDDLTDVTPTVEISREFTALPELAKTEDRSVVQHEHADHATGRRSVTGTESDLDISEQRDDMSTDSMYADDEAEETMDILFTKTYTEPIEGAEVFLSCTVVNSAYKEETKKREVWLSSDEALEYFEANASEVMSTAFMKAKQEMKDIQLCLQNLRKQMDNFHGNYDDISLPDLPMSDSFSPDYRDVQRKAVTD